MAKQGFAFASYLLVIITLLPAMRWHSTKGSHSSPKYQAGCQMQAHINSMYALLATASKQRVLHLLVDSVGTSLWWLVLRIALGHHTPRLFLGHLALGCDWNYLVLLRVSLSHVNGACQDHSNAMGHVTITLMQPFPTGCYTVMDVQICAIDRDAMYQQSIYNHCGYTHLICNGLHC